MSHPSLSATLDAIVQQTHHCLQVGDIVAARETLANGLNAYPDSAQLRSLGGKLLINQGHHKQAIMFLQKAVQIHPKHFESHLYLGIAASQFGQVAIAQKHLHHAVDLQPDSAVGHYGLGVFYQQQQQYKQSEFFYRRTLELDDSYAQAYSNLGLLLKHQGRFDEAKPFLLKALMLLPESQEAHINLGTVYQALEDYSLAEQLYTYVLSLNPDAIAAQYNLGLLWREQGLLQQAEEAFRQVIKLDHTHAKAHRDLGVILKAQDRWRDAEASLKRSIELAPDDPIAYLDLSTLLREQSRWEEAYGYASQAFKRMPKDPEVLMNFIKCRELSHPETVISLLNHLLQHYQEPSEARELLLSVIARAYHNEGYFDQAFSHYQTLNHERHKTFDAKEYLEKLAAVKRQFTTSQRYSIRKNQQISPIFIVGLSRSGKSLTESLLSHHPQVQGIGEHEGFLTAIKLVLARHHIDSDAVFPSFVPSLEEHHYQEIGDIYLKQFEREDPIAPQFIVNTSPGHVAYLGVVLRCFPDAIVLHCQRHPLDTCLYMYFKQYKHGNDHAYDLRTMATYYRGYEDMMAYWRQLYPDQIHAIEYEELVRYPRRVTQDIYDVYGLKPINILPDLNFHCEEIDMWTRYESHLGSIKYLVQ